MGENMDIEDKSDNYFLVDVTPLCKAVQVGNIALMKQLLQGGADINGTDTETRTPLHIAVQKKCVDAVQLLLEHGANVTRKDKYGYLPIDYIQNNKGSKIYDLLETMSVGSFDLTDANSIGGASLARYHMKTKIEQALQYAKVGDTESLKRLWLNGVEVDVFDSKSRTPLHVAVQNNQNVVIELLLSAGANPNFKDCNGQTPLTLAEEMQSVTTLECFHKYDYHSEIQKGEQIIRAYTYIKKRDLPSFQRIVPQFVPFDTRDYDQRTFLHVASSEGYLEMVQYLVQNGADLNCLDRWTSSPLSEAENFGHLQVANYLREKGAMENFYPVSNFKLEDLDSQTLTVAVEYILQTVAHNEWILGESHCPVNDKHGCILVSHNVWYKNNHTSSIDSSFRMKSLRDVRSMDPITLFRKARTCLFIQEGQGLIGSVYSSRQPKWLEDISTIPQSSFFIAPHAIRASLYSCLAVPMLHNGKVISVLTWYADKPLPAKDDEIHRIQSLVRCVTLMMGLYQDITCPKPTIIPKYQYCQALQNAFKCNADFITSNEQDNKCSILNLAIKWKLFDPVHELATSMSSEDHHAVIDLLDSLSRMIPNQAFSISTSLHTFGNAPSENIPSVEDIFQRVVYYTRYLVSVSPPEGTILLRCHEILSRLENQEDSEDLEHHDKNIDIQSINCTEEDDTKENCVLCKFNVPGHIHKSENGSIATASKPSMQSKSPSSSSIDYFGPPHNLQSPILHHVFNLPKNLEEEFNKFSDKGVLCDRSWDGNITTNITPRDLYDTIGQKHSILSPMHRIRKIGSVSNLPPELLKVANEILLDQRCDISIKLLHELQNSLDLEDPSHSGVLRKTAAVGYASSNVYRTFLPPGEIEEALHYLINSFNSELVSKFHPLLKAFYTFSAIVYFIHPFHDGNGRCARLVGNLILRKHGYPMVFKANDKTINLHEFLRKSMTILDMHENLRRSSRPTRNGGFSITKDHTSTWF